MSDKTKLSNEELDKINGGRHGHGPGHEGFGVPPIAKTVEPIEWDEKGRAIRWRYNTGQTYHYTCPKCGRYLHFGAWSLLFCDPCDDYWFSLDKTYD